MAETLKDYITNEHETTRKHFVDSHNQIYRVLRVLDPFLTLVDTIEIKYYRKRGTDFDFLNSHLKDRIVTPKDFERIKENSLARN